MEKDYKSDTENVKDGEDILKIEALRSPIKKMNDENQKNC